MKRILYLEPIGGIAGDMFLAAVTELGVDPAEIADHLSGLRLPAWKFSTTRASRHAISGTHLDVVVEDHHGDHEERSMREIRQLLEEATTLPPRAKARALQAFDCIAQAEAKIHNTTPEQIHFHELGAVDSIVDLCGAAVALELLGDPQVYAQAPPLGSGSTLAAHGNLPVPAPGTLEILRDCPVRFEGSGELTTPTGAAILKVFCTLAPPPEFMLERVGYGVGTREWSDRPNVLRASLGHVPDPIVQDVCVVEANFDDSSPQLLGDLIEKLMKIGALDAYILPATMKKSRPGHLLGALVPANLKDAVIEKLLSESSTLGVRFYRVERRVLDRAFEQVETSFGTVRIKVGTLNGQVMNAQPEFEDCRRLAEEHGVPLKRIWAEALARYHRPAIVHSSKEEELIMGEQWDRQILDFLKRTGEEIKSETQKILEDIRAPENQQRIRDSLNDFGAWAKNTAENAAGMLESALQKAETALNQATDRVLGKAPPKDGGNGAPARETPPRREPKRGPGTTRRRAPASRRMRPKRR